MIFLITITAILIFLATYFQFESQSNVYNSRRFIRKEMQVYNHLNYIFTKEGSDSLDLNNTISEDLDEFYSIAQIHNVEYAIYSLDGQPLFFSYLKNELTPIQAPLKETILKALETNEEDRYVEKSKESLDMFLASYVEIKNKKDQAFAILYFPYFVDNSITEEELSSFRLNLYEIYVAMLIVSVFFGYFISRIITKPIIQVSNKILQTGLLKENKRINISGMSKELELLVNSYNDMVDELHHSAMKLAKSEREVAWREMGRQIAHEIKNPLTPMRLLVQDFEMRFDPNDPQIKKRLKKFSKTMIEQIDTMDEVSKAFSDFAMIPRPNFKKQDIISTIKSAIALFPSNQVRFNAPNVPIYCNIDKSQITRVIINLVSNSLQSLDNNEEIVLVEIELQSFDNYEQIDVKDNGMGISEGNYEKIFEPKFSTKTDGMGLGLGIVKNIIDLHKGEISFTSELGQGTTFSIKLFKNEL